MKKIIIIISIIVMTFGASVGLILVWQSQTNDMRNQEDISEMIAEKYIVDIEKQYLKNAEETEQDKESTNPSMDSEFNYDDNEIYSYFDESYAWGHVDCVIEIPAIDLRQSVFTGDADEIEHDLSRWLPVTARTDYTLGDTQYCIYMHNPRNKSIKISMAQENLQVGDYIVVTQKNNVYLYSVTGVFSEWRNKCTENYVNSDSVGPDKLYIFTCAREEWQGKNLVIEGTMYKTYSLLDWTNNKDKYISDYKYEPEEDSQRIEDKQLILNIENKDNRIIASVTDSSFQTSKCIIGIFDKNGYLIDGENAQINYSGGTIEIPELDAGTYYIGIYECQEGYYSDSSYLITVDKEMNVVSYDSNLNISEKETLYVVILQFVTIALLSLSIIFGVVGIVKTFINKKHEDKIK